MAKLTVVKTIGTVKTACDNIVLGGEYLAKAWTIGGQLLALAKTHAEQGEIQGALVGTYITATATKEHKEMRVRVDADQYDELEDGEDVRDRENKKVVAYEQNALRQINKKTNEAYPWAKLKSESTSAKKASKTRGANKKIKIEKLTKKQKAELESNATSKPIPAPMDCMIFRSSHIRHDLLNLRVHEINVAITIAESFDQSKLTEADLYDIAVMKAIRGSL
jgi:hypothetical protein